jgi:hypothetical protein
MTKSLRTLLSGIIDYAGLFPPAKLPLEEAIRNYARYRTEPEAWMLGRFICPAARLGEVSAFADLLNQGPSFAFSALGRGGDNREKFLAGLDADLNDITQFRSQFSERGIVDAYEVRLLQSEVTPDALRRLLSAKLMPFFEINMTGDWRKEIAVAVSAIRGTGAGFKLRCGGLEASAFPSVEQVAETIVACRDAKVPLKFTAGLHHPLRRFDAGVNATMHGFLNVFLAGVFAHVCQLSAAEVQSVLEVADASRFRFEETQLAMPGRFGATLLGIETVRNDALLSFGSCSFDEPRDDLRALGLL